MMVIFLVAAGCVPMQTRAIGEAPPPVDDRPAPEPEPRVPASPPAVNTGGQLVAAAPPPSGEAILAPAPPSPTPSAPPTPDMMPPSTAPTLATALPPGVTTPPARTTPPPADPDVIGQYRVLQHFGDAFIAEVLVVNTSRRDRDWTVTLRFPDNVGRLYAAWVEGAPQATLRQSGRDYVFTSSVPVAGHSSVPLRFHFQRYGSGAVPQHCAVNGTPCQVR